MAFHASTLKFLQENKKKAKENHKWWYLIPFKSLKEFFVHLLLCY